MECGIISEENFGCEKGRRLQVVKEGQKNMWQTYISWVVTFCNSWYLKF
jgi:hypothetical protein